MSHEKREIYADNASTTSVNPRVLAEMLQYLGESFGNPLSLHAKGRDAGKAMDLSRLKISKILNCKTNEIYFTSGGTEANNLAIKGAVSAFREQNANVVPHVVTTKIEHHSVIESCRELEKQGVTVTYLDVDKNGSVTPESVSEAVKDNTALVCVMYANNEVGTVLPIVQITKAVKAKNPKTLVFTDAVQAVGHLPINLQILGVDMLSFSGHKFNAPKGIGALYVKEGTPIKSIISGGVQENGLRAGTQNVAFIVALGVALELAAEQMLDCNARLAMMRDELITRVLKIPGAVLTGHPTKRLPGLASFVFSDVEGESVALLLDMENIYVSTSSACAPKSDGGSHVLTAMGVDEKLRKGALRISLGFDNTMGEVEEIAQIIETNVKQLREN